MWHAPCALRRAPCAASHACVWRARPQLQELRAILSERENQLLSVSARLSDHSMGGGGGAGRLSGNFFDRLSKGLIHSREPLMPSSTA